MEFSAFDCEDGTRYFYLISVDIHNVGSKTATLRVGKDRYSVSFPFGRMVKAAVKDGSAVWSDSEYLEISGINGGSVKLEGSGDATVYIAKNGEVREYHPDFSDRSEALINV